MRRLTIDIPDDKFEAYQREVGEIIGIAAFIEADVRAERLEHA